MPSTTYVSPQVSWVHLWSLPELPSCRVIWQERNHLLQKHVAHSSCRKLFELRAKACVIQLIFQWWPDPIVVCSVGTFHILSVHVLHNYLRRYVS